MDEYLFKLVDVFTENPLEGNQLAVVFEADNLSDEKMIAITREFNYSETTFVLRPRNSKAAWRLRSFTLAEEVFGAGHQTLGAWWAIAESNLVDLRTGEMLFIRKSVKKYFLWKFMSNRKNRKEY